MRRIKLTSVHVENGEDITKIGDDVDDASDDDVVDTGAAGDATGPPSIPKREYLNKV